MSASNEVINLTTKATVQQSLNNEFRISPINSSVIKQLQEQQPEPVQKSYHQVIFLTRGHATFFNQGEIVNLEGPTVFLIAKETSHFFIPNQYAKGWVITFTEDFISHHNPQISMQMYRDRFVVIRKETTITRISTIVDMISNATKCSFNNRRVFIRHLLAAFMTIVENVPVNESQNKKGVNRFAADFTNFVNLLEENYKKQQTVSFYAEQLKMSTRKLAQICSEMTGKSTLQLIEERRIIEAKKLLIYSRHNAQQVAYELGFQDHSYFTKVFRKHVKITPLKFRKKYENGEL